MILVETHSLKTAHVELFAEQRYLWEREKPTTARHFFEYGFSLEISHSTRNYAHACRLLGHIALHLAQPDSALSAYQKALTVSKPFVEISSLWSNPLEFRAEFQNDAAKSLNWAHQ